MAIIRKPFAARLRFRIYGGESVQSLSRVRPSLQATELQQIRQAINNIRRADEPITGGVYTIQDELTDEA